MNNKLLPRNLFAIISYLLSAFVLANTTPTISITPVANNTFTGEFNDAPLRSVLEGISSYTDLDYTIYPKAQATYTFSFKNLSEKELITKLIKKVSYYRVLDSNNPNTIKKLVILDSIDGVENIVAFEVDSNKINYDFTKKTFNSANAKQITTPLTQIPQVQSLLVLANNQKQTPLLYERVVDPNNPQSAYTFKVKYHPQHNMMIPYEKNGKPHSHAAEGFMNFATVANTLENRQEQLNAYQSGEDVYITFKDTALKDTYMVLNGDENNMEVVQYVGTKGLPNMNTRLIGDTSKFYTLTNIQVGTHTITLSDVVTTQ